MFNFKKPRAKQLGFAISMGLVIAAVNLIVSGQAPNRAVSNPPAPEIKVIQAPPSLPGMVLIRRQLAQFIRFASRVTAKSTTPAL